MAKEANFSFMGELPKYEIPRSCFGMFKITNLFFFLTSVAILQLVIGLAKVFFITSELDDIIAIEIIIAGSIYGIVLVLSLYGLIRKNHYSLISLIITEIFLVIVISSIPSYVLYFGKMPNVVSLFVRNTTILHSICLLLVIFHIYFLFVVIKLFINLKRKAETDAFVARQKMLDAVCIEMIEEEEAANYRRNRSVSYCDDQMSYSNESVESSGYSAYIAHMNRTAQRQHVSFHGYLEDSY